MKASTIQGLLFFFNVILTSVNVALGNYAVATFTGFASLFILGMFFMALGQRDEV